MRISELHLGAFGHFADVRLRLDAEGPALHVIYGQNEAGKSTTRRALMDLFFGIPTRTADAHRHPMPKLRIGARLVAEDGTVHAVVRKKGNKDTLLGPDDVPVDESVMRKLLAHVARDQFEIMFGLDHVTLRESAAALLSGSGDVGESLYGASLGGSIHEVITGLDEEAAAIFTARGKQGKTLNAAIAEYKEAHSRLREAGFTPEGYKTQVAALDEARKELAARRKARSELHAERGRVERAVRVMPRLATLRRLESERDALPDPGGLADIEEDVVERLKHDLPVLSKSERDIPNREAARRAAAERATEVLRTLGRDPDLEAGRTLLPSPREREALWRLIEQHGELVTDVRNANESLDEKRAELALLGEATDEAPIEDVAAVEAALSLARPLSDAAGRLAALAAETEALGRVAERLASALPGFGGDAAAAAALAVPDAESVERDAETRRGFVSAAKTADDARDAAKRKRDELERAIEADERLGHVPAETDLVRERRERDGLWATLRRVGLEAGDPDGYEGAVSRADESADIMRREADRVAQRAQRGAELRDAEREIAHAETAATTAAQTLATRDEATRKRWEAIGVEAPNAEAMRKWCSRHAELLRAYEAVETKRTERAALEARVQSTVSGLARALGSEATDVAVLVRAADTRVEAARERRHQEKSRVARQRAVEGDVTRLDTRLENRRDALRVWSEDWAARVTRLGVAPDASPRQVSEVLESLNDLERALAIVDDEQLRIDKMREDARRFEEEVDALAGEHAPDLAELPLAERGRALIQRIDAAHARVAETKRLDDAIRAERQAILDGGDGKSIEELEADTAGLDIGQQRGRAANIEDEVEELNDQVTEADQNVTKLEGGIDRYQTRTSAAEAADDLEAVLARVREAAHRYVRLRLAREVLRAEIARFREENQGPILARANALFPKLTTDAYVALKVANGEGDEPVLRCVRKDGEEVGVDGLSDGTKDQLYLALRLASLLHFAEHNAPLPLVLDDCLVHFDDDRARAALGVLGEVSRSFQILFFTHHKRLVELAEEAVSKEQLRVCDLGEVRARAEARA